MTNRGTWATEPGEHGVHALSCTVASAVPVLWAALFVLPAVVGCTGETSRGGAGTLVVYNAGSLARPMRAAMDSFARATGVRAQQESAGSIETARKLTELRKVPDVIALADVEVFPTFLQPEHTTWYIAFATNRMVLAYTPGSRYADVITTANWYDLVQRPGVEVGRADPNLDPNGYRTLMVFQLAELHYGVEGLARRLLEGIPRRNVRPKEADLVGLLQAGELDYAWSYESLALATGLRYVRLPDEIDLGNADHARSYQRSRVLVSGRTRGDTVQFIGTPILYGFSIPREAPTPEIAVRFAAFLLGEGGKAALRSQGLSVLDVPRVFGEGVPPSLADSVRLP